MKKLLFLLTLILSISLLAGHSFAVSLSLDPVSQQINLSDFFNLNLNISGLGNYQPPSLGAFDLGIIFDPGILSFSSVNFGPFLGDLSIGEADANIDTSIPGVIGLDETSWLYTFELDALQADSFTLATLTFQGIGLGTSLICIDGSSVNLSDGVGQDLPLSYYGITDAGVTVNNPVPEPSTVILFFLGLVGLVGLQKKFS